MRILVGSIQHETNTFNPEPTGLESFSIARGNAMLSHIAVSEYFRMEGCEIIPTLYANAVPSGKLKAEDFRQLLDELISLIPTDSPIDGVWLYCHGAMKVESVGSGDLAILSAVRARVGPEVPIAVALDFHANNSAELVRMADIVCGYRTAPHIDMQETQLRVAKALLKSLRDRLRPKSVLVRIPMALTGDMVITAEEPMSSVVRMAVEAEETPGILSVSVFNGQPWVDSIDTGASVIAVAEDVAHEVLAKEIAHRIALHFWEARTRFRFQAEALDPTEAIAAALGKTEAPVFISDSGDNTTAGAPGNRTDLLQLLLAAPRIGVLLAGVTDPIAVKACHSMQKGHVITQAGDSPVLEACLRFGRQVVFEIRNGILGWDGEDAGEGLVLRVDGLDVIVTERRCAIISPEIIESVGVRLSDYRTIVVKLGYLYPALARIAHSAILALTPGASSEAIADLDYHDIRRPLYPVDPHAVWLP
jgi:microcystin degradation protein MlrC